MIDVEQRRAADAWFLEHGLPAVLRPGRLVRRLWPRSAPALAAFAVFMINSAVVVQITGKHTINIEGEPTRTEWFVLGLLVLVLPVASLVGWLVSRISTVRGRTVAAIVAVLAAIAGGIIGGPSPRVLADLIFEAVVIATILATDRVRPGLDSGVDRADDVLSSRCGGVADDPRTAGAASDVPGVLQFAGVAHGGHRLARADCGSR